jgi:DNA-binding protein HU-beta
MTQAQFFQAVAEGSQVNKVQVRAVFQAVEEIVTKRLKAEGKIPLGGLGAVKLVDRKARIGRNPATGEQIKIPARTAIKITPAKSLKDTFNKKGKKYRPHPLKPRSPLAPLGAGASVSGRITSTGGIASRGSLRGASARARRRHGPRYGEQATAVRSPDRPHVATRRPAPRAPPPERRAPCVR